MNILQEQIRWREEKCKEYRDDKGSCTKSIFEKTPLKRPCALNQIKANHFMKCI